MSEYTMISDMSECVKKIDCFVFYSSEEAAFSLLKQLKGEPLVGDIHLMMPEGVACPFAGCDVHYFKSFGSMETMRLIGSLMTSKYALMCTSPANVTLGYHAVGRMLSIAESVDASVVYSDRYLKKDDEIVASPAMDCYYGSVRDDFDFGNVCILSSASVKQFLSVTEECDYMDSSWYALHLYCLSRKRNAALYHIHEYLYTEDMTDRRSSGEKQFDYVDRRNSDIQKEREIVFTGYLKNIGAYIEPESIAEVAVENHHFEKEASVIIPVRNRVRTIEDAVRSALSQRTNFDFNVMVVDNHSTDGTSEVLRRLSQEDSRVLHIIPERDDLGIGGCWNLAFDDNRCGRFAVQLDSDDLYSGDDTLQRIVDKFYEAHCGMVIGSYRMCDFKLDTLPPGLIDHKEWTPENGHNNALRVNGFGAPRAFYTPLLRSIGMPNTSYGEDYAVGLAFSRKYKIGRIFDQLYLCRRWEGNSDAALTPAQVNKNNMYKDGLRTIEIIERRRLNDFWQSCVSSEKAEQLLHKQLPVWDLARNNYEGLSRVVTSVYDIEGCHLSVQHNPVRMVSTGAKVDAESIKHRPCFLCEVNRPKEQLSYPLLKRYYLLVNPNPILPMHFTMPLRHHCDQAIKNYYEDMMEMAVQMNKYFIFYNGPKCGASAPDHMHFQAGSCGVVPLQRDWVALYKDQRSRLWPITEMESLEALKLEEVADSTGVFSLRGYVCPGFVIITRTPHANKVLFDKLYNAMHVKDGDTEPMMNILAWIQPSSLDGSQRIVSVIIPRSKHRPDCYYEQNEEQILVSPGAIDMAGMLIVPRAEDYCKMNAEKVKDIISECGISRDEELDIIMRFKAESGGGIGLKI